MKSSNKYLVVVIFSWRFIASVLSQTACDRSEFNLCKIDGYVLDSDVSQIVMFSTFNTSSVTSLQFKNSLVSAVPLGLCRQFKNLESIDMSQSQIMLFGPSAIASCTKLRVLNLSHNFLTNLHVPEDVVIDSAADNLEKIDLSYNRIYNISPSILKIFRHLTSIDLSHNEITVLASSVFPWSLKVLNLNFNKIATFSAINLINIEQINLSDNQLVSVKLNPSIRSFEADNNFLQSGSLFDSNSSNLISLSLKNNSYENFSVISNLSSLLSLDMSFNQIKSGESDAFENLINLKTLILKSIGLKSVDIFSPLRDLETLDISGNNLDWIDFNSISCLANIKQLKLSNNNLNRMTFQEFDYLFHDLKSVDISENNWECEDLRNVIKNFDRLNVNIEIDGATNFDNLNQTEMDLRCTDEKRQIDELGNLIDELVKVIKHPYMTVLIIVGGLLLLLIILSVRNIVKLCLSKYKKYKLSKKSNLNTYSRLEEV